MKNIRFFILFFFFFFVVKFSVNLNRHVFVMLLAVLCVTLWIGRCGALCDLVD